MKPNLSLAKFPEPNLEGNFIVKILKVAKVKACPSSLILKVKIDMPFYTKPPQRVHTACKNIN